MSGYMGRCHAEGAGADLSAPATRAARQMTPLRDLLDRECARWRLVPSDDSGKLLILYPCRVACTEQGAGRRAECLQIPDREFPYSGNSYRDRVETPAPGSVQGCEVFPLLVRGSVENETA